MHLNSILIFREHVAHRIPPGARVLEIGPDGDPSSFFAESVDSIRWESADLASEAGLWSSDNASAKILMPSEYEIPAPDDTYDVVFSAQVAEHVRAIWTWMCELARVTRPGGQIITISPVSWPYHEAPVDCWRMYPDAMRALCEHAGLEMAFAWWGSLEPRPTRRPYPGVGEAKESNAGSRKISRAVKSMIGWPLPVAYDMVTVATKPTISHATPR